MQIFLNNLRAAIQGLKYNRLRNLLSVISISFGIFVIISILSVISSLQVAIRNELRALGDKVLYVQKWPSDLGPDGPWWKMIGRPEARLSEMKLLEKKLPYIRNIACLMYLSFSIRTEESVLKNVKYYGITEKYNMIQDIQLIEGRFLLQQEFDDASNTIVMGYNVAELLFGKAESALNKEVYVKGNHRARVIGVIRKQGETLLGGLDYDNCILLGYDFMRKLIWEKYGVPVIMVQAEENMSVSMLKEEVRGCMRSIRQLKPSQEDNFAVNDIESYSIQLEGSFNSVKTGAWAISALALFIGMFNIANVMYAIVYERIREIGLKKAIGAKRSAILSEFLVESVLLSLLGGLLGLVLVVPLAWALSYVLKFFVFVPPHLALLSAGLSITVGLLAGFLPAWRAASMNPVEAINVV